MVTAASKAVRRRPGSHACGHSPPTLRPRHRGQVRGEGLFGPCRRVPWWKNRPDFQSVFLLSLILCSLLVLLVSPQRGSGTTRVEGRNSVCCLRMDRRDVCVYQQPSESPTHQPTLQQPINQSTPPPKRLLLLVPLPALNTLLSRRSTATNTRGLVVYFPWPPRGLSTTHTRVSTLVLVATLDVGRWTLGVGRWTLDASSLAFAFVRDFVCQ